MSRLNDLEAQVNNLAEEVQIIKSYVLAFQLFLKFLQWGVMATLAFLGIVIPVGVYLLQTTEIPDSQLAEASKKLDKHIQDQLNIEK